MRIRIKTSTLLDLFGVACIAGFAYLCWPPSALLVIGAAALAVSWVKVRQ